MQNMQAGIRAKVKEPQVSKRLVINADDFNLSPAVSRGIHELLRDGCITSTSCLVYSSPPEVPADIRDRVGVHLRLTDGTPSLRKHLIRSLLIDGRFPRDRGRGDWWHKVDPEHVRLEWERQIVLFLEATGGRCTHLDTHHHVHAEAVIFAVYESLCEKYGFAGVALNQFHGRAFALRNVRSAHATTSLMPMPAWENTAKLISAELNPLPGTTIWAWCHPGYVDEQLRQHSTMTGRREQELEFLRGAQLRKGLADAGIGLIGACDL